MLSGLDLWNQKLLRTNIKVNMIINSSQSRTAEINGLAYVYRPRLVDKKDVSYAFRSALMENRFQMVSGLD